VLQRHSLLSHNAPAGAPSRDAAIQRSRGRERLLSRQPTAVCAPSQKDEPPEAKILEAKTPKNVFALRSGKTEVPPPGGRWIWQLSLFSPTDYKDPVKSVLPLVLLLCAVSSVRASAAPKRPPNIVLLYSDDIGWGDLGCYGSKAIPTPNLDKLAADGVRFTAGYCTTATCTPSRYSLLTGEYAWRRKGTGVLPGDARLIIKPGRPTVASSLAGLGYATGVVGKWHLGLGDGPVDWNKKITPSPNEIGFTYSFIMAATGDRVPTVFVEDGSVVGLDPRDPIEVSYKQPYAGDPDLSLENERARLKMDWSHGHNMALVNGVGRIGWMKGGRAAVWNDESMGDTFAEKACAFIAHNKDKPFFLYYASHENHVPRVHHPRYAGRTPLGPRGDAVVAFDDQAGRILAELEKHGLTGNTLVIYTSDNGPVLDDGYKDRAVELNKQAAHSPAGPFRGGKYSILEGGTRVGFIVRWPGHAPAGKVSDALVSQVDLPAVFTRVAGGDPADFLKLDSVDTSAALSGGGGRNTLISSAQAGVLSIRDARWKFISGLNAPAKGRPAAGPVVDLLGSEEARTNDREQQAGPRLFDLEKDPAELHNVAAEHPDIVERMDALLKEQRAKGFAQPLPG
jgi:arylsulfatase A-like enzyme